MIIECPCTLRVTKKILWLPLLLASLFFSTNGQAQGARSIVLLPAIPQTYLYDLQLIGKQLKVHIDHDPIQKIPELNDICNLHGKKTFGQFFAPLKARGLIFRFISANSGKFNMLIIKRAPPAPIRRSSFSARAKKPETDDPAPGTTARNPAMGKSAATDDPEIMSFPYVTFPVKLRSTHIGQGSDRITILKDIPALSLAIDPQSLDAVSVSYAPTQRALSTSGYSTITDNIGSYPYYRSAHRLSGIPNSTVPTMLEGRVPGVLVTSTSGIPGSYDHVTIRGQTSVINGVDPLYIIDGVPEASRNASLNHIQCGSSSQSLSSWTFIAPGDIERIDVLRDGDATAIYGSRGANGVVLVTTKHWKAGFPKWDVEFSTGTSSARRQPTFMNTAEYLGMRREALHNSGLTATDTTAPDLTLLDTLRNLDWGKWLLGRNARNANLRLALTGGKQLNNYTVGMDYFKESTPFPTQPDHDRLTTNFNYNHRSPDRRWTLHLAGLTGWDANHQFIAYDPAIFRTLAPDAPPPLDQFGRLNFPPGVPIINPLSQIRQPYVALSSNYLLSVVSSYALANNLVCQTTVGLNRTQTREFGAMPLADQNPAADPQATGYFSSTRFDSRIFEPELEYKRQDGKLLTSWLGGASLQSWDENAAARADTGYANDLTLLRHDHATIMDTSSQTAHEVYTSLFTSLNANWNDRYILNFTGRRDGSSRFPADRRFGYFGSVAFAWIFFDANPSRHFLNYVSYGKIKASEGVTGNNQIGDRTLQYIAGTSIQSFQSIPGLYPANPTGIGWEKTYKSELSLDLGFLQNRILFNATAYRHRSDNLLEGAGFAMPRSSQYNNGWPIVLENSGYELSVSGKVVDKDPFRWDIAINWTFPQSKLVSFPELNKSVYADRLVVGQSLNILRGYIYKGVDKQSGLYTFADLNRDGRITQADEKIVGKFDVTGFGGIENTIRWKQFQLQVLIDARFATGLNYLTPMFANNPPGSIDAGLSSNYPRALLNHWRQPGDDAAYQRIYAISNAAADSTMQLYLSSSALFANASFLRLRKLSITYNVPVPKAAAMHLSSLAFFVDAQNLFTASPYKADPEIQSVLMTPTMKTIEIGIRLTH